MLIKKSKGKKKKKLNDSEKCVTTFQYLSNVMAMIKCFKCAVIVFQRCSQVCPV